MYSSIQNSKFWSRRRPLTTGGIFTCEGAYWLAIVLGLDSMEYKNPSLSIIWAWACITILNIWIFKTSPSPKSLIWIERKVGVQAFRGWTRVGPRLDPK
ncbi:hypothetical protein FRX31_022317 [Thalictrum thalictroides]|uniref:Uncharacterized protein n=1 Tax=Thalictrum thalictroides TaxID=46969 RepID=A0A7J6VUM5_THATH|nr:hypothetical protein FRX31_022317 [Thalictrum thalictroides]